MPIRWTFLWAMLFVAGAALRGEDLRLQDGRVLKDARIIHQSELRVTVQHAEGVTSVNRTQLPVAQRSQPPTGVTTAEEESRRAAARSAKARAEEEERRNKLQAMDAEREAARARAAEKAKRAQQSPLE